MTDFNREERYIVIKLAHLTESQQENLADRMADERIEAIDCVVVEADWQPLYDMTWHDIQRMAEGRRLRIVDVANAATERENKLREELRAERERADALAACCQEAAAVLERTANDTLDGRNMAEALREQPETSLAQRDARLKPRENPQ